MHSEVLLILSLLLWSPFSCDAGDPEQAKTYTINLDLPPEERWNEVVADFKDELKILLSVVNQRVPSSISKLLELATGDFIEETFPRPYGAEMVGIANRLGIAPAEVLVANLLYELTAYNPSQANAMACTSIVAQAKNGTIYHGRNLDYGGGSILTAMLRNVTIIVDFKENGQTVYMGTTYAGYIGLITGQKGDKFTVSLDQRNHGSWWMNAFEGLVAGTHGVVPLLIRSTLADPYLTFEEAVETLSKSPVIAPCYIIVGGVGPNEGAVITRGRAEAHDIWRLGTNHTWYLVETNYDHWGPPPPSDDRRHPAINQMNQMGQSNLSLSGLFSVLSTPPVLNAGTTYTTVMSAAIPGAYNAWVRHPSGY